MMKTFVHCSAWRTEQRKAHIIGYVKNDLVGNITWVSGEFNEYHGFFSVDKHLSDALELYFIFRGPPEDIQIIIDNVSFSTYQHVPNYDGTRGGFPQPDFSKIDSKYGIKGYNQTVCDILVANGDLEVCLLTTVFAYIVCTIYHMSYLACLVFFLSM